MLTFSLSFELLNDYFLCKERLALSSANYIAEHASTLVHLLFSY